MERRGKHLDGGQLDALPEVALQQAILILLRRLQDTKESSAHSHCTSHPSAVLPAGIPFNAL